MNRKQGFLFIGILISLLFSLQAIHARADDTTPPREQSVTTAYTEYIWWVAQWSDNRVVCNLSVDHLGFPTGQEIYDQCGDTVWSQWSTTPSCKSIKEGEKPSSCSGVYLQQISAAPAQKRTTLVFPSPFVWLQLTGGCTPTPPNYICDQQPVLLLSAEEPMPDQHITAIQGQIGGVSFSCDSDQCEVPLPFTPLEGMQMLFWAQSSLGDVSQTFTAQVRVLDGGLDSQTGQGRYIVHILSDQWIGETPWPFCSTEWGTFPPVEGLPTWLQTPASAEDLNSDQPYTLLAGRLIDNQFVDASSCDQNGLFPSGAANACGLAAAREQVTAWQNLFNADILSAAQQTNVPGQLLKNLFSQESQFWPGEYPGIEEVGLGQIKESGTDTALLWNTALYHEICPLVFNQDTCQKGYSFLTAEQQAMLRGMLIQQIDATCADCPNELDIQRARSSVLFFAQTLSANCLQTGQVVTNITNQPPGQTSSYTDLWRFTLANYQSGSGCLSQALQATLDANLPLSWDVVVQHFSADCQNAVNYVNGIAP